MGGRAHGLFPGDEDTEGLREPNGAVMPFDDAWTFPVTAELEIAHD